MKAFAVLLAFTILVGCGVKSDPKKDTAEGSSAADPKGSIEKIWQAWQTCESKTGHAPEEGGMFDKYLKDHGKPSEILKGISIRWGYDTRKPANRQILIAWQTVSKDGKYYALSASGKIDRLDADEMGSRGVAVGDHLAAADQFTRDNIKERVKDNEDDWGRTKKVFDEDERTDDALEKQMKTPEKNPAIEEARKRNLVDDMKALAKRRESRKAELEIKRKVYEQQKMSLEDQLKK